MFGVRSMTGVPYGARTRTSVTVSGVKVRRVSNYTKGTFEAGTPTRTRTGIRKGLPSPGRFVCRVVTPAGLEPALSIDAGLEIQSLIH